MRTYFKTAKHLPPLSQCPVKHTEFHLTVATNVQESIGSHTVGTRRNVTNRQGGSGFRRKVIFCSFFFGKLEPTQKVWMPCRLVPGYLWAHPAHFHICWALSGASHTMGTGASHTMESQFLAERGGSWNGLVESCTCRHGARPLPWGPLASTGGGGQPRGGVRAATWWDHMMAGGTLSHILVGGCAPLFVIQLRRKGLGFLPAYHRILWAGFDWNKRLSNIQKNLENTKPKKTRPMALRVKDAPKVFSKVSKLGVQFLYHRTSVNGRSLDLKAVKTVVTEKRPGRTWIPAEKDLMATSSWFFTSFVVSLRFAKTPDDCISRTCFYSILDFVNNAGVSGSIVQFSICWGGGGYTQLMNFPAWIALHGLLGVLLTPEIRFMGRIIDDSGAVFCQQNRTHTCVGLHKDWELHFGFAAFGGLGAFFVVCLFIFFGVTFCYRQSQAKDLEELEMRITKKCKKRVTVAIQVRQG